METRMPEPISPTDVPVRDEMAEKLMYLQIFLRDLGLRHEIAAMIAPYLEQIAKRHYDVLELYPHLQQIIDGHSRRDRLEKTFVRYFRDLFLTDLTTAEFYEWRKKIGKRHSRIRVTSEWYAGSYVRLFEFLIPVAVQTYRRNPRKLADLLLASIRMALLDMQLILEAYEEATQFRETEKVSEVLEAVIAMDAIAPAKACAFTVSEEAESIAAATQQLSASVQDMAQSSIQLAEYAHRVLEEANEGGHMAQTAMEGILRLNDSFGYLQTKFGALEEAASRISGMSDVIRRVADQTHLLSLNAAIEAAHAGEHGRGFRVVASEVRSLATQTKEQVAEMEKVVKHVQTAFREMAEGIAKTAQEIRQHVETAQTASGALQSVIEHMHRMNDFTASVAANTQQQAAATEDIARRTANVLENTMAIREKVDALGAQIYETSVRSNDLREGLLGNLHTLDDDERIRLAQLEPLLLKWWLHNARMGYHAVDPSRLADPRRCQLGQWLERRRESGCSADPSAWRTAKALHDQLHEVAAEILGIWASHPEADVRDRMDALDRLSRDVVQALEAFSARTTSG
ncbi:methyl-accepting chemotaxis protein [Alicyclobacillus macrosporangiidus]|nr:methyl-accepting chemotaxis protein [Alicyclobacillus macrosporangiidus]